MFNFNKKKQEQQEEKKEEKQADEKKVERQEVAEKMDSGSSVFADQAYKPLKVEERPEMGTRHLDKNFNYKKEAQFLDPKVKARRPQPKSVEPSVVEKMKKVMFQNTGFSGLPKSWSQGFILQDNAKTFYGILQKEGGPCGVIAALQCYFLKHYLFLADRTADTRLQKENCLIAAITDMLTKLAEKADSTVVLAVPSGAVFHDTIPLDCIDQVVFAKKTTAQVYDILLDYKDYFLGDTSNGVALLFYSAILTKGVDRILQEMDTEECSLIGNHGHCAQEGVNLLLTGIASSQCFNGTKTLDENYILKGVGEQQEFGFLTILEYYKYLEVGTYYKQPLYPIWVICKEYHYTVLFAYGPTGKREDSI